MPICDVPGDYSPEKKQSEDERIFMVGPERDFQ